MVQLCIWDIHASMFDNDVAAGLVPTIFAEDPDTTTTNMNKDLARLHGDIMKMNRIFFSPEVVTVTEAASLFKKPREGAAFFPFKKPKFSANKETEQPPNKRPRVEEEAPTEIGM